MGLITLTLKIAALLDVADGVEYEGERIEWSPADTIAAQVAHMIGNGNGAIDWAGLPYAVERFGITDIDGLLDRLDAMRRHRSGGGGGMNSTTER